MTDTGNGDERVEAIHKNVLEIIKLMGDELGEKQYLGLLEKLRTEGIPGLIELFRAEEGE